MNAASGSEVTHWPWDTRLAPNRCNLTPNFWWNLRALYLKYRYIWFQAELLFIIQHACLTYLHLSVFTHCICPKQHFSKAKSTLQTYNAVKESITHTVSAARLSFQSMPSYKCKHTKQIHQCNVKAADNTLVICVNRHPHKK